MTDKKNLNLYRLCIVACIRSGTHYIAQLLQDNGWQVGHESLKYDGGVGFSFLFDRGAFGLGKMKWQGRAGVSFGMIFHQIREPLAAIRGIHAFGDGILNHLFRMLRRTEKPISPLYRAACLWYDMNSIAESLAGWTYRVEDICPGHPTMHVLCRQLNISTPYKWPRPRARAHMQPIRPPVTWRELIEMDSGLTKQIMHIADRYGYETGKDSSNAEVRL